MTENTGQLIVLEGGDGTGKTTTALELVRQYQKQDIPAIATYEPGGTGFGDSVRAQLLKHADLDPYSELLLMFAMRREHVEKTLVPFLNEGYTVVCDRFLASTYVYQVAMTLLAKGYDYQRDAGRFPSPYTHPITEEDELFELFVTLQESILAKLTGYPVHFVHLETNAETALERLKKRPDAANRLDTFDPEQAIERGRAYHDWMERMELDWLIDPKHFHVWSTHGDMRSPTRVAEAIRARVKRGEIQMT